MTTASIAKTKLLLVETNYFVAGAVWQKIYDTWSCTHSAPILAWMRGKSQQDARLALAKMGADYSWISLPETRESMPSHPECADRKPPQGAELSTGQFPGTSLGPQRRIAKAGADTENNPLRQTPLVSIRSAATAGN